MAGVFWRAMSMQHWPDEVRRLAGASSARDQAHLRPFAEGETLVETPSYEELDGHRDAWRSLADRAIEPNPFLEPSFALSAMLHLPAGQRPDFALVWQGAGFDPRARLIGVMALERRGLNPLLGVARTWRYRHAALCTPLIDRFAGPRAIDALLKWLSGRRPRQSAFVLDPIVRDGPVFDLLVERCAAKGLTWSTLAEHERAVLLPGQSGLGALARARSTKHRREMDRLRRRLSEAGAVSVRSASAAADVRVAAEWFLALEQKGWKGRRGTALLSDVGDAAFLRTVVRLLAQSGRCRIDWLALDDRPIAMAVMLISGDRAYFWKTAYDEAYAHYSPGVQLARELIERQTFDPEIVLTDSCAIADHPMIDRIWPDRQTMVEMLIGVDPARPHYLAFVAGRESLRRNLRAALKRAAYKALGRRAS